MDAHRLQRESLSTAIPMPLARRAISTRSQNLHPDQILNPGLKRAISNGGENKVNVNKRKADANSPLKNKIAEKKVKRSALGNLTNATIPTDDDHNKLNKKIVIRKPQIQAKTSDTSDVSTTNSLQQNNVLTKKNSENQLYLPAPAPVSKSRGTKILTRAAARSVAKRDVNNAAAANNKINKTKVPVAVLASSQPPSEKVGTIVTKPKDNLEVVQQQKQTRRISNEFEKTEDSSLYMSAIDDMSAYLESKTLSELKTVVESSNRKSLVAATSSNVTELNKVDGQHEVSAVPDGVVDFDKENWDDPYQVSHYAMDIFAYLKERESEFIITDYMDKQVYLTAWMRSLLIDWMVEVQESFELNHETLYLAVKLVDIFLGKGLVTKDMLQLLGAAALFIASKFDERIPPLIDDFLYICDGAYDQNQLINMERQVFKSIGYDLGMPLSYRFLRRYARCSKVAMPVLTLARYILELSLMDYATIHFSDSKMAAAALFMANRMNNMPGWTKTLIYYSGYELKDFANIVPVLNTGIHRKPRDTLNTIRNKYSHTVFLEVTKVPLKTTNQLLEEK